MILEPHTNVKTPMVKKPVHMIKPRVVTLQKSLHSSLERRQGLMETNSSASLTKNVPDSVPITQHERSFGKFCVSWLILTTCISNSHLENEKLLIAGI